MRFSVVIPTYNRAQILEKAVSSVLTQSYTDFEVIVIDNGSTDHTKEIIDGIKNKDSRVTYFWQENSGSPAGSRNTGICHAQGEWLAFLDSDDLFHPQKLERVNQYLRHHPDLVAIAHGAEVKQGSKIIEIRGIKKGLRPQPTFDTLLLQGNFLTTSATLIRRNILEKSGGFNPCKEFAMVEDYDLWLRLARLGSWGFMDEILTTQFVQPDQLSHNIEVQQENLRHLLMIHLQNLDPNIYKIKRLQRICHARVDYYKGKLYLRAKQSKRAIPNLWSALLKYPWSPKAWWFLLRAIFRVIFRV
jgi:teichuronic acid biosynthesis glycosyltransferase TuaG